MPPGTSPDRPGSREVLRRRPDRWTSRDTLSSPGTPTITPGGGGTVRPRITPNLTPVIHDDDPPELSPPPGLRLDRDADPGNDLDRFQPDPPHIWPRYDGEHDEDGGDYGDDDYHDDDEPYGGGHHYPPETVIEDVICDDFHYHHHYHYNFLDCGPGYWHHWRWGHRPWHGWRWWYCDGWDGWSFWFSFWGGRSCRWWFSFSFSFGDDFWGYCHPWRHYRLRYDGCYVRYHRPWRGWLRRHYRPHYYLHSRWPWQYHPGYDDWSAPRNDWYLSYRVSTPVYYVVEKPQPALPNIDDAWGVLRRGDLETARDMFSDLVYALPYEGEARIGYALASGLLYRDSAAVSAMRRAMRDEPSALRAVPRDASLRQRLRSLLDFYADRARRDFGDLDALFMVAALRYLLDEPSVAYFAADAAIRSGDEDTATRNLKLLIEETMYEAF
ncbi:MAG: hypothetical protein SYC29_14405 [Planctomycetota bacterium]|nr:hypothetical protein [Planctomycetota bacterium]